jgi:UDP-glucose 4-epimerase
MGEKDSRPKLKKVLITGGFGLVGGRLSRHLAERGFEVLVGSRSEPSIQKGLLSCDYQIVKMDWSSIAALESVCDQVDFIVHAAAINAAECRRDPAGALETNAIATYRLFRGAQNADVKKLIYLSTVRVYTPAPEEVITEASCISPSNPYSMSKWAGESLLRHSQPSGKTQSITVRLANSYGAPNFDHTNCWNLLINDLCKQAVVSNGIELKTAGIQYHDFVPLEAVCQSIYYLLVENELESYEVVNLASGESKTVWEMACLVKKRYEKLTGRSLSLTRGSELVPVTRFRFDVCKLEEILQGKVDHAKEIDRLILYCLDRF